MKKAIISVLLFAVVITFVVVGCKNEPPKDYFPIGVGSSWEYMVYTLFPSGLSQASKDLYVVSGKELVDDLECYRMDYFTIEGNTPTVGRYQEFLAKTSDGVTVTKRAFPLLKSPLTTWALRNSPGEPRFKNNLKDGDRWKWKGFVTLQVEKQRRDTNKNTPPKTKKVEGSFEYEYRGKEEIKVQNKKIECIKIYVHALSDDGQEFDRLTWYGPGIGKVREETIFYKGKDVIKTMLILESYNIVNRELFKVK